jgi:hypothetical protein
VDEVNKQVGTFLENAKWYIILVLFRDYSRSISALDIHVCSPAFVQGININVL